jgi:predicted transcriptional regulator of viral defense system
VSSRGATAAVVLAYLKEERAIGPMLRYMQQRHGLSASAVREQVRRLTQSGKIERVSRGRYRRPGE